MMHQLINRYKRFRTKRLLSKAYQYSYAFVGMGQHSMTNLYPVLHYLGVPMKYICVTSKQKALLIESKIPHIIATTSIDDILGDDTVKGIFVSASPEAHFSIASRILKTGKSLNHIEPCETHNCNENAQIPEEIVKINLQMGCFAIDSTSYRNNETEKKAPPAES